MKNILYSLLAVFFISNISFAQLMSDEDHKAMMSTYKTNVDNLLSQSLPQGITLDQYKKNIVLGTATAPATLVDLAQPLLAYANQFKAAHPNLLVENDAQLYFLSSFAPSTTIDQNGVIVETAVTAGITAAEMWNCAIASFNSTNCGISVLVTNKGSVTQLGKAGTTFLTQHAGLSGVLVMLGGFSSCLSHNYDLEKVGFVMSRDVRFLNIFSKLKSFSNQIIINQQRINDLMKKSSLTAEDQEEIALNMSFDDLRAMNDFQCGINADVDALKNHYLAPYSGIAADEFTIINAADRYNPAEPNNHLSLTKQQAGNFGAVLFLNSCPGENPGDITNSVKINWDMILTCGGAALGLTSVKQLYQLLAGALVDGAAVAAGITLSAAAEAFAIVASHYVGLFAIACTVYSFVSCARTFR